jgi:LPXTG-motif cell wall-anchored protein
VSLAACAFAAGAWGQNADPNTAGPTRNDYRLRVVQPVEGATILGENVQLVVDTEIPAERDTRQDVNSMPRPRIDVFLNGLYQGTMKDTENVLDLENVTFGTHEIVLLAKNMSGEIIDRRVLHVTTMAPPRVAKAVQAPPPAPVQAPPPAPEPEQAPPPTQAAVEDLPVTGTSNPLWMVVGLALLAAGFIVRRLA